MYNIKQYNTITLHNNQSPIEVYIPMTSKDSMIFGEQVIGRIQGTTTMYNTIQIYPIIYHIQIQIQIILIFLDLFFTFVLSLGAPNLMSALTVTLPV